jgi:undecaprenyl-diphosphatase
MPGQHAAPRRPLWRPAVVGLALILLAMTLVDGPLYDFVGTLDRTVIRAARILTRAGDSKWAFGGFGILLAGAVLVRRFAISTGTVNRLIRTALFVLVSLATTGIAVMLLKVLFGRARPKLIDQFGLWGFEPVRFGYEFASFPSGHATTVFALAMALGFLLPRLRIALLPLAAGLAATRVVIGAHYLSDILAGALLAMLGVAWLRRWMAGRGMLFTASESGSIRLRGDDIRTKRRA